MSGFPGGGGSYVEQSAFPGEYWIGPSGSDDNDGGPGRPFLTLQHAAGLTTLTKAHLIPTVLPGSVFDTGGLQLTPQGWSVWEGGSVDPQNGQATVKIHDTFAGGLVAPGAGTTLERMQIRNAGAGSCVYVNAKQGAILRQVVCYDNTLGGPVQDGIELTGDQVDQFDAWQCTVRNAGRFGFLAHQDANGVSPNAWKVRGGFWKFNLQANLWLQGSGAADSGPIGGYNARIEDIDMQANATFPQLGIPVTTVVLSSGTIYQFTTLSPHGITSGETVTLSGFTPTGYNVAAAATVVDAFNFTLDVGSNPGAVTVFGIVVGAQVCYGWTSVWGYKVVWLNNIYSEASNGNMHIPQFVVRQSSGQVGAPSSTQQQAQHIYAKGIRHHGTGLAADFPTSTGIWWDLDGCADAEIDISGGTGSTNFSHANPAVYVRANAYGVRVYVDRQMYGSSLCGGDPGNVMNGPGNGINGNQVIVL